MAAEAAGGRRRKSRNWESRKQKSEAARRALRPCLFLLSAFLISAFPRPIMLATRQPSPHVPLSRGNHAWLLESCEPFGSVEQSASSALTLAETYENN